MNPGILPSILEMDWQMLNTSFGPIPVRTRIKKRLDQMSEYDREALYKRNAARINQFLRYSRYQRAFKRCRENQSKAEFEQGIEKDPRDELALDRAYRLHVLLSGEIWPTAEPIGRAIEGGTEIGNDLDCGPARFLTAHEVREIAVALAQVSEDQLMAKLDSCMIDYELVTQGDVADSLRSFVALRDYYEDAASRGNAVILFETWHPPVVQS